MEDISEFDSLSRHSSGGDRLLRREKYRNYAVFVPFLSLGGETHIVFEKRSASIRQGGEICFPGGGVETDTGELPETAAVRETHEELGLAKHLIEVKGRLGHTVTHWGSAIDLFYGTLRIDSLSECSPHAGEVEKIFTVPLSFFRMNKPEIHFFQQRIFPRFEDEKGVRHVLPWKDLGLPKRYSCSWTVRTYPVLFFRWEGETIWGMTAELIMEIVDLLKTPG